MIKVQNLRQVRDAMIKSIETRRIRTLETYGEKKIEELLEKVPVASGKLKKSIGMKLRKGLQTKLEIFASAPYAQYADTGTQPGNQTKVSRLEEWGKVKAALDERKIHQIRRRIFEKGTEGSKFWTKTFEKDFEKIDDVLEKIYHSFK